ncbi:hypothetical protein K435DRAFT_138283 [Dendrothele bispora CBS 962.96]|uniref:Uncharacterized protein n=1 Tax=Dendrothele bispora (strain CBS 962.96) TaxID=1314807 RepID=A0A4S8MQ29_DENBC|nr:hypothetical protein K435DRAFT_138283 [Dendrothele bispora CBS 962.96]
MRDIPDIIPIVVMSVYSQENVGKMVIFLTLSHWDILGILRCALIIKSMDTSYACKHCTEFCYVYNWCLLGS